MQDTHTYTYTHTCMHAHTHKQFYLLNIIAKHILAVQHSGIKTLSRMSRIESSATRTFFLKQPEFIFSRASTACLALPRRTMSLTHDQELQINSVPVKCGFHSKH